MMSSYDQHDSMNTAAASTYFGSGAEPRNFDEEQAMAMGTLGAPGFLMSMEESCQLLKNHGSSVISMGDLYPGTMDHHAMNVSNTTSSSTNIPNIILPASINSGTGTVHMDFDLDDNAQLFHDILDPVATTQHHALPASPTLSPQHQAVTNWEENIHVLQEMLLFQQQQTSIQINGPYHDPATANLSSVMISPNPALAMSGSGAGLKLPPSENDHLLSLLQLPRCASSSFPSGAGNTSSIHDEHCRKLPGSGGVTGMFSAYANQESSTLYPSSSVNYQDPHMNINAAPNSFPYQVSLKHLLHTSGASVPSNPLSNSHLINEGDLQELKNPMAAGQLDGRQFASSLFDFKRDSTKGDQGKGINHFATERQRREYLNEKYQTLRSLVPNPSKADRASIVQDAIEYVKELKRTLQELQILVQEKNMRAASGQPKKRRMQMGIGTVLQDMESTTSTRCGGHVQPMRQSHIEGGDPLLRSSLLQRTSQHGTHVDVRIVEDDVNIRVTLKKKKSIIFDNIANGSNNAISGSIRINGLSEVVGVLHELRLDLLHASGATIGDHHIFMLNTKIMEGCSTFAGQIASKMIEALDRHCSGNYMSSSY